MSTEGREMVSLRLTQGHSLRAMARDLGRVPSNVSYELAQRLAIPIFFADPYNPWQRGTNESTQWPAAPVSAQGHRLVRLRAARVERHGVSAEHAPMKMFELRDACESLCAIAPSFTRALGT